MSVENEQPARKDRQVQVKPESIKQKAEKEQPDEFIDSDQSAPRGRRPLFRS